MKSRIFKVLFENPESEVAKKFVRHLDGLLTLDDNTRTNCLDELSRVLSLKTEYEVRRVAEDIATKGAVDRHTVDNAFSILKFFVQALTSNDVPSDDYKCWVKDLRELNEFDEIKYRNLECIIESLHKNRQDWKYWQKLDRTQSGVLPKFNSMGVTVEARAIYEEKYLWGMCIDQYTPKVLGLTYVASVSIGVDQGPPENFYFQLDSRSLDNMINSLLAARKEIEILQHHVGGVSNG